MAGSQVGFIGFVVFPYFEALSSIFPKMNYTLEEMNKNKELWKEEQERWTKVLESNGNADL